MKKESIKAQIERLNELDKLRTQGDYKVVHGKKSDELFIEADTRTGGRLCRMWNGRTLTAENAEFLASAPKMLKLVNMLYAKNQAMRDVLPEAKAESDKMREEHKLKIWSRHFEDVLSGAKKAEHRVNDRDFKVGAALCLEEITEPECEYTGRKLYVNVTHIIPNGVMAILSIEHQGILAATTLEIGE